MYEYNLETHLSELARLYPQFTNLYSTWTLNKRTCAELLKSVILRYPHYSLHDSSHAEAVVSKIEMLLGDRIKTLSPTDTWLLLNAAYSHDLGMLVKWSEIEEVWDKPEFQHFISSLKTAADEELRSAAFFFQDRDNFLNCKNWPLVTYRYVSLINASYFRSHHAEFSKEYIDSFGSKFNLDLSHNGLIQPRLIKLLGQICALHTKPNEKVLELEYQTNGFGSDYAHPRFISMMLRLGDLLDIDNNRFNTGAELSFGGLPPTSIPHKEKHNATTQILITPEEIRFKSDCPNSEAYLEARRFVSWLDNEIDFLTKYWARIVPKELGGYAPTFDCKELLINGVEDIDDVAGLRFEISQDKAFQIIEGSNIYNDRLVFVREVIQNAIDASKIQLWRDLKSGVYKAWISEKIADHLQKIQPYELDKIIYNNYPIEVSLNTLTDGKVEIVVTDRGTGISVEDFKRMCNVGTSAAISNLNNEESQSIPKWLKPTAGFGIGLQSVFLIADKFEIDTSTGTESLHAVLHSRKVGGYIQLQKLDNKLPRGTTIRIAFFPPTFNENAISGDTRQYIITELDTISSRNLIGEMQIMDCINYYSIDPMFPLQIRSWDCSVFMCSAIEGSMSYVDSKWTDYNDRYCIKISPNIDRIQIWDKEIYAYAEFSFVEPFSNRSCEYFFKGVKIYNGTPDYPEFYFKGISVKIDVYGLETNNTVNLDRSSLTLKGYYSYKIISNSMVEMFIYLIIERLKQEVSKNTYKTRGKFDPYTFWKSCNNEQRKEIPVVVLRSIKSEGIPVIYKEIGSRNSAWKINRCGGNLIDIICNISDIYFTNIIQFINFSAPKSTVDYKRICKILNSADADIESISQVVVDEALIHELGPYYLSWIVYVKQSQPLILCRVTVDNSDNVKTFIKVGDTYTKNEIIKGLGNNILGLDYDGRADKGQKAKRYVIPAIEDFSSLAVKDVPFGLSRPVGISMYYIISPFVREEEEKRRELSEDAFTEMVISSSSFQSVVEYVMEHPVIVRNKQDKEQIVEEYEKLIRAYYRIMSADNIDGRKR